VAATAAEQKSTAPAAPEPSISSAKKEFDILKAARDPNLQPKGDAGRSATMPGLELDGAETPSSWLKAKKEMEKKKKSANWLIDAMEKERKADRAELLHGSQGKAENDRELDPLRAALTGEGRGTETSPLSLEQAAAQAGTEGEKDKERPASAPQVVNPLARYMGDWMTPKDLALLQTAPTGGSARETGGAVGPGNAVGLPGGGGGAQTVLPSGGGGLEAAFGLGGSSRSPAPAAPRENPFLQGLQPVASSTPPGFTPPVMAPLPPVSSGPAPSVFQPESPVQAPLRTTVPDFAKPAIDDKAFKPMKRF
jgi:hypothetical protein